MRKTKDYRKLLGFTNGTKAKEFLTAKDIVMINWPLVEAYNERLVETFSLIQNTLPCESIDIGLIVENAYQIIRNENILPHLSNHGRAPESVYFVWMQGYLSATIFQPLIENELDCKLIQNGADDLSDPSNFGRKSDPDLADHDKKIYVEVQSGFKGSKVDIKKSKVKESSDYTHYIACFDCYNGLYTIINTRQLLSLPDSEWYHNPLWEGALCYTVPHDKMKKWKVA